MLTPIIVLQLRDRDDLSEIEKESLALYAMISFGFGEVLGGILMGLVIDYFGSKMGSLKNVVLAVLMTASTYGSLYYLEYNYLTFIMCFLWGYVHAAINIHSYQILGFEFDD